MVICMPTGDMYLESQGIDPDNIYRNIGIIFAMTPGPCRPPCLRPLVLWSYWIRACLSVCLPACLFQCFCPVAYVDGWCGPDGVMWHTELTRHFPFPPNPTRHHRPGYLFIAYLFLRSLKKKG